MNYWPTLLTGTMDLKDFEKFFQSLTEKNRKRQQNEAYNKKEAEILQRNKLIDEQIEANAEQTDRLESVVRDIRKADK